MLLNILLFNSVFGYTDVLETLKQTNEDLRYINANINGYLSRFGDQRSKVALDLLGGLQRGGEGLNLEVNSMFAATTFIRAATVGFAAMTERVVWWNELLNGKLTVLTDSTDNSTPQPETSLAGVPSTSDSAVGGVPANSSVLSPSNVSWPSHTLSNTPLAEAVVASVLPPPRPSDPCVDTPQPVLDLQVSSDLALDTSPSQPSTPTSELPALDLGGSGSEVPCAPPPSPVPLPTAATLNGGVTGGNDTPVLTPSLLTGRSGPISVPVVGAPVDKPDPSTSPGSSRGSRPGGSPPSLDPTALATVQVSNVSDPAPEAALPLESEGGVGASSPAEIGNGSSSSVDLLPSSTLADVPNAADPSDPRPASTSTNTTNSSFVNLSPLVPGGTPSVTPQLPTSGVVTEVPSAVVAAAVGGGVGDGQSDPVRPAPTLLHPERPTPHGTPALDAARAAFSLRGRGGGWVWGAWKDPV